MKILPSRFLSVVNKYVNIERSFLGRRVSNRRRSIGIVYPSVDTYRMHFRTFFRSTFTFLRRHDKQQSCEISFSESNSPRIAEINQKIRDKLKRKLVIQNWATVAWCLRLSCVAHEALKTLRYIMVRDNVVRFNLLRFHFACFQWTSKSRHDYVIAASYFFFSTRLLNPVIAKKRKKIFFPLDVCVVASRERRPPMLSLLRDGA